MTEAYIDNEREQEHTFTAYEYMTIHVPVDMQPVYNNCYKSFGWSRMGNERASLSELGTLVVQYKRDRKIRNREDVNYLQHQSEAALQTIEKLERKKTSRAMTIALVLGLGGAAFLAGAVFSFIGGIYMLHAILGLIGLVGWGLAYPAYRNTYKKTVLELNPRIDEQYDILYEACEEASRLLS